MGWEHKPQDFTLSMEFTFVGKNLKKNLVFNLGEVFLLGLFCVYRPWTRAHSVWFCETLGIERRRGEGSHTQASRVRAIGEGWGIGRLELLAEAPQRGWANRGSAVLPTQVWEASYRPPPHARTSPASPPASPHPAPRVTRPKFHRILRMVFSAARPRPCGQLRPRRSWLLLVLTTARRRETFEGGILRHSLHDNTTAVRKISVSVSNSSNLDITNGFSPTSHALDQTRPNSKQNPSEWHKPEQLLRLSALKKTLIDCGIYNWH